MRFAYPTGVAPLGIAALVLMTFGLAHQVRCQTAAPAAAPTVGGTPAWARAPFIDHTRGDAAFVRGFHGGAKPITRSFKSDTEAERVFRNVLKAAGREELADRIVIRASPQTDNAQATVLNSGPVVFYNVVFMQDLATQTKTDWSMVAVVAHEVAHHILLHTVVPERFHEFELEADRRAGEILAKMGATRQETVAAFGTFPVAASPPHPGRAERVQVATLGWLDGRDRGQTHGSDPIRAVPPAVASVAPAPGGQTHGFDPIQVGVPFRDCRNKDAAGGFDCPEMVVVPAGEFTMGSTEYDDEKPPHKVTIARPFAVGKFEVTFAEWKACVAGGGCASNKTPGNQGWPDDRRPVIDVDWHHANEYAKWLSGKTGKTYRLLSEAEWEYAARAGTATRYSWGNDLGKGNANCAVCGSQWDNRQTAPVGSFKANAWGLHDMHGNVWEWVEDNWHPNYKGAPNDGKEWPGGDASSRVVRGGSWLGDAHSFLRSAVRFGDPRATRASRLGFRLARTL